MTLRKSRNTLSTDNFPKNILTGPTASTNSGKSLAELMSAKRIKSILISYYERKKR